MNETRIFVSPQEAADLIGCHRSTVYEWLSEGFVPSVKIGGLRRIRVSDLRNLGVVESPGERK